MTGRAAAAEPRTAAGNAFAAHAGLCMVALRHNAVKQSCFAVAAFAHMLAKQEKDSCQT